MMSFGYRPTSNVFERQYHVNSTGFAGKDITDGDKIFLPPSAFEQLARMVVEYPMLFEARNVRTGRKTHCGVLEFSSEEGFCYMPFWMMQNLGLEEGHLISIKNVSLKKATFVKLRAQSVDFLEVHNPRALLEVALRQFTCLTVGDVIRIPHAGRFFDLEIREVQPDGAASIIETDCNVDFEEPLGYKESKYAEYERKAKEAEEAKRIEAANRTLQRAKVGGEEEQQSSESTFKAFSGTAKRIDGKSTAASSGSTSAAAVEAKQEEKSAQPPRPTNASVPQTISYESKIGDKYSKKKSAVAAFGGPARKLSG